MNRCGRETLGKYVGRDKHGIELIKTFLGIEEKEILFGFGR